MKLALFDYGAGNLHSLQKALELSSPETSVRPEVIVTSHWGRALSADALVLPGVGSFGAAVRAIAGEEERVRDALDSGLPCLGICLGMQLLFPSSEEAGGRGIGFVPGRVRRLRGRIVPQMGWNDVTASTDPLFGGIEAPIAYFANSFVCEVEERERVIAWTEYEGDRFAAGVRKGETVGVQFHPEKSSGQGLRMIRNFLERVAGGSTSPSWSEPPVRRRTEADPRPSGEEQDPRSRGEEQDPPSRGEEQDPPSRGEEQDPRSRGKEQDPRSSGEEQDP